MLTPTPHWLCLILIATLLLSATFATAADKHRCVVLTDIRTAQEPDDAESLVRLLTYSNEIDIKGLVVNTSTYGRTVVSSGAGLNNIDAVLADYEQARPNLLQRDSAYPTRASLQAIRCNGQSTYGMGGVGSGRSSAGSNLIIDEVLNNPNDTRPLWVLGWGGVNTLAQALYDVEHNTRPGKSYTASDLQTMRSRIRVYDISGQDDAGAAIAKQHPDLTYLRSSVQFRAMSYRVDGLWQESRGGDETKCSQQWFSANAVYNHEPLSSSYHHAHYLYEGDSPSFLFLIPNGLSDPEHMNWGSWGGRFGAEKTTNPGSGSGIDERAYPGYEMHVQAADTWTGKEVLVNNPGQGESSGTKTTENKTYTDNVYAPLFRFREALQNDFAARMDWAAGNDGANRNPVAVLNGDTTKNVLASQAKPGDTVTLSAAGSSDPDSDTLTYSWWVYQEAGSYLKPLNITNADQEQASLLIPDDALDTQIHVILEITDDDATVPLTSYRRQVINVSEVPEPGSLSLLLLGGAALAQRTRK